MPRKKQPQESEVIGQDNGRLIELLARIPTQALVDFIARAAFDREDARELCDLIRALR